MTIKGPKVYHWPVGANDSLEIWISQEQGREKEKKAKLNKRGGKITAKRRDGERLA